MTLQELGDKYRISGKDTSDPGRIIKHQEVAHRRNPEFEENSQISLNDKGVLWNSSL